MSKANQRRSPQPNQASGPARKIWFGLAVVIGLAVAAAILAWRSRSDPAPESSSAGAPHLRTNPVTTTASTVTNLPSIEAAQAVVVTVDLDFSGQNRSIKEALKEIERRHQPEDGVGRTFAMLDAWGETNVNGKMRVSMHLSMEKPGIGALVFKPKGEELWKSRILPAKTGPPGPRNLTIIMEDNAGSSVMLDGTKGATRVLDVPIHNSTSRVRDLWPDGQEREFTFVYSACGCPVKAKVRRQGDATVRTTELPVLFPDDPAALSVINALMGWPNLP
jgi:flagellar basal body-associated protein FliL